MIDETSDETKALTAGSVIYQKMQANCTQSQKENAEKPAFGRLFGIVMIDFSVRSSCDSLHPLRMTALGFRITLLVPIKSDNHKGHYRPHGGSTP